MAKKIKKMEELSKPEGEEGSLEEKAEKKKFYYNITPEEEEDED